MANCSHCSIKHGSHVCGGCKQVVYCSSNCQASHWNIDHKIRCDLFARIEKETQILRVPPLKKDREKDISFPEKLERMRLALDAPLKVPDEIVRQIRKANQGSSGEMMLDLIKRERAAFYRYQMLQRISKAVMTHLNIDPMVQASIHKDVDGPTEEMKSMLDFKTFMQDETVLQKMEDSMESAYAKASVALKQTDYIQQRQSAMENDWIALQDMVLDVMLSRADTMPKDLHVPANRVELVEGRGDRISKTRANAYIALQTATFSPERAQQLFEDLQATQDFLSSPRARAPYELNADPDLAEEEAQAQCDMLESDAKELSRNFPAQPIVKRMIAQAKVRTAGLSAIRSRYTWIQVVGFLMTAAAGSYFFYQRGLPNAEIQEMVQRITPGITDIKEYSDIMNSGLRDIQIKMDGLLDTIASAKTDLSEMWQNLSQYQLTGAPLKEIVQKLVANNFSVADIKEGFTNYLQGLYQQFQAIENDPDLTPQVIARYTRLVSDLKGDIMNATTPQEIISVAASIRAGFDVLNKYTTGIDATAITTIFSVIDFTNKEIGGLREVSANLLGRAEELIVGMSAYGLEASNWPLIDAPSNATAVARPIFTAAIERSSFSSVFQSATYQFMSSKMLEFLANTNLGLASGILDILNRPSVAWFFENRSTWEILNDGPILMTNAGLFLLRATRYSVWMWWLVEKGLSLGSLATSRWAESLRKSIELSMGYTKGTGNLSLDSFEKLLQSGALPDMQRREFQNQMVGVHPATVLCNMKYLDAGAKGRFMNVRRMQKFFTSTAGAARSMTRSVIRMSAIMTASGMSLNALEASAVIESGTAQTLGYGGMLLGGAFMLYNEFYRSESIISTVNYRRFLPKSVVSFFGPKKREGETDGGFDTFDKTILFFVLFYLFAEILTRWVLIPKYATLTHKIEYEPVD